MKDRFRVNRFSVLLVFIFSITNLHAQDWKPLGPTELPSLQIPGNYFLKRTVGIGRVGVVRFFGSESERQTVVTTPYGGWYHSIKRDSVWKHNAISSVPVGGVADIVFKDKKRKNSWVLTGDADCLIDKHSPALGCESCQSAGIYSSKDGGKSFTGPVGKWMDTAGVEMNGFWNYPSLKVARKLIRDPSSSKRYYTVVHTYKHESSSYDGYVFCSKDDGKKWKISLFVPDGYLKDIELMPGKPSVIYASGRTVFRSDNRGRTWKKLNGLPEIPEVERMELAVSPLHPEYVWVMVVNGKTKVNEIYMSTDRGESFQFAGSVSKSPEWRTCMAVDAKDDRRIYVSSGNQPAAVWFDGKVFRIEKSAGSIHDDLHELTVDEKNGAVYASTDGGLYRSLDHGQSWKYISNGMNMAEFWGISVSQKGPIKILGGLQDAGTLIGSEDSSGNVSWTIIHGGDGMDGAIAADEPLRMLHNDGNNDIVSRSDDGGKTWSMNLTSRGSKSNYRRQVSWNPQKSTSFFVGYQQLFKSDHLNAPLRSISDIKLKRPENIQCFSVSPQDSNTIYLAYSNPCWSEKEEEKVFVTRNGGTEWKDVTIGLVGVRWFNIAAMTVNPVNANEIYVGFTNGALNKLMYSSDAGEHWADVSLDLPLTADVDCMTIDHLGKRLFIGTHTGVWQLHLTTKKWSQVGVNLPPVMVSDLEWRKDSDELYAGTHGCGLWKIRISEEK